MRETVPPIAGRRTGARGWDILLGLDLGILAMMGAASVILTITGMGRTFADVLAQDGTEAVRQSMWTSNVLLLVSMGIVPAVWLLMTRRHRVQGSLAYMRVGRVLPGLGWGVLTWMGIVLGTFVLSMLLSQIAPEGADNPELDAMAQALTWPLILATALVAGIAEEILFRGILQRWVGLWGQAVLFAIVHAGYGTVAQVVFPLALGLLFGWMVRRGAGLIAVVTAHVLYDLGALALVRYCVTHETAQICGA